MVSYVELSRRCSSTSVKKCANHRCPLEKECASFNKKYRHSPDYYYSMALLGVIKGTVSLKERILVKKISETFSKDC